MKRRRHRHSARTGGLVFESLEHRHLLDSTVVFSEVMYHPADDGDSTEWIELHNQMAVNMDVSRWSIDGIDYEIPDNTTLPGGGYLVIARDPTKVTVPQGALAVLGPFSGQLSNGGERLRLRNVSGRIMDELDYGDRTPWPAGPDGGGPSLAKRDAQAASGPAENWAGSPFDGGTPGAANFPPFDPTPVETSLVSPSDLWRSDFTGQDLGTEWRGNAFDDSTWTELDATLFAGEFLTIPPPDEPNAPSPAQSIVLQNPSFEANTHPDVGYGPVDGWTSLGTTGINPALDGATPFADNGSIPDSRNVAFIQGRGSIAQVVSGLQVGRDYLFELYYNARDCCRAKPTITASLAGTLLIPPTVVDPVDEANAYHVALVPFTATSESGQLLIRNVGSAGDHSLLLDAVAIKPLRAGEQPMQNGSFEASGTVDGQWLNGRPLAGWSYQGTGDYGVVDSGSPWLNQGQVAEGNHAAILRGPGSLSQTVTGLQRGRSYELRYRYNAHDNVRLPSLSVAVDGQVVRQHTVVDPVGENNPFHMGSYRFTATDDTVEIRFEQTNPSLDATWILDDVIVRRNDSPLVSRLPLGPTTYYFRQEIDYSGNPAQTELRLRYFLDDGAIFYLNGQEIHRSNMPNGPVDAGTFASSPIADPAWSETIVLPASALRRGPNALAVEVHQASVNDPDMAFDLELLAVETPVDTSIASSSLAINEIGGASANALSIELVNIGSSPLDLRDYSLQIDSRQVNMAASMLPVGDRVVVPANVPFTSGDLVTVRNTRENRLVDALHLNDGAQARFPDGIGPWRNAPTSSLGAVNQIPLETSVVINEILYHQIPDYGRPATPPTFSLERKIDLDHAWRYVETGGPLPADWMRQTHAVGGDWQQGNGLLGFETGRVIAPGINTQLTDTDIITYYFETDIPLTESELARSDQFRLRHAIDDGAVFYLNGEEFFRFNMPDGPIGSDTVASRSINNAELSDWITVPADLMRAGNNRLSVEVHQRSSSSSDLIFGLEFAAAVMTDPGSAEIPFGERAEEWVELFNRGSDTVDLSGWSLDNAVRYTIPDNTLLQPGEYLVVANQPEVLRRRDPAIRVLGPFGGQLADDDEQIQLRDQLGNLVDQVHYYDGGRWPELADGKGSSLELIDPAADNSVAQSWAASSEPGGPWREYAFRAVASEPRGLATPDFFDEFIIGLLDAGEILLDDMEVIEDPAGAAIPVLQNGTFENDRPGEEADAWRIIGNHGDSVVTVDPDDPSNQVLRLTATGATEHMQNHGETTLKNRAKIKDGTEYEFRFRAKWLNGSPQLNTRLYFVRAARTTILDTVEARGTPGAANSRLRANAGPVYRDLTHRPLVPAAGEPVTVSVRADDPQGVSQLTLYYSVDGASFLQLPMVSSDGANYRATIPGGDRNDIVQFFVTGQDSLGAVSHFPARGEASRALYRVDTPLNNGSAHSLRLIMTRDDVSELHANSNVMSNGRLGATLIYDDRQVFYDVGVRLRASGFGRQGGLAGFNIRFDPQELFRGVHRTIALDRGAVFSNGNGGGVQGVPGASPHELLIYQIGQHAGGIAGMYDDVVYVDAPRSTNTGFALLKMARYTDEFLDSQFDNGSDGSLFKYELIYHSTATIDGTPEGLKRAPNAVIGTDISDLGNNKEAYRPNFVLKNNRDRDDFSGIIQLGKAFSQRGEPLSAAAEAAMDVDQWARTFALTSLVGVADSYNMGLSHNLELFVPPNDGKVLAFPWDVDHGFFYPTNSNILGRGGTNLARVFALPQNTRLFYKHLLDIIQSAYNVEYVRPWAEHYASITGFDVATFLTNYVQNRSRYVLDQLDRLAPQIPFAIDTNDGQAITVNDTTVTLTGTGWIDVHQIRLANNNQQLNVRWLDASRWEATVPLLPGENVLRLIAEDYRGNQVGTDMLTVTSTVSQRPLQQYLRIVELMYNPPAASAEELKVNANWDNDDFEFVELMNTSETVTLDLTGVRMLAGPSEPFAFATAAIRSLAPGERLVLVANPEAFAARYGALPVAGTYSGNLSNRGERLHLVDEAGITIVDFAYGDSDPWPVLADGSGYSLELIDPVGTPVDQLSVASVWRASAAPFGTPLSAGTVPGDFNGDGSLTATDLDLFCGANANDLRFDLNGDGSVTPLDFDVLVEDLFNTTFGDANLDGIFDSADLLFVFQIGQYRDGQPGNSHWISGDWNCDGEFDTADLLKAFQAGRFVPAATQAAHALATSPVRPSDQSSLIAAALLSAEREQQTTHRPVRQSDDIRARDALFAGSRGV